MRVRDKKLSATITVIGFGSLLSEQDARRSCPNLTGFRRAVVRGHRRVFHKVDSNIGGLTQDLHIADWTFSSDDRDDTLVTVFEVPAGEWPVLVAREFDYDLKEVPFEEADTGKQGTGIGCFGFESNAACDERGQNDPMRSKDYARYRRFYSGPIYRQDIFPWSYYLARCLNAAHKQATEYVHNILDHAYLADGETTIRSYLKMHGLSSPPVPAEVLASPHYAQPDITLGQFMERAGYIGLEQLDWLERLL